MAKKLFSLIVVPHYKGKHKTITLTDKRVKILGGIFTFIFIVLSAFIIDYFTMNVTRKKFKELSEENVLQKQTLTKYKVSFNKLEATLKDFENYARKINIMAGLKSPEVSRELGVGGGGRNPDQGINSQSYLQDRGLAHMNSVNQKAEAIDKDLKSKVEILNQRSTKLAHTPTIWPTTGWQTSAFGMRDDPFTGKRTFHYGMDIAANYGNPIVATADGLVAKTKKEKIGGNTIIISHGGGVTTVYCHLSGFNVKPGQKVKRSDVIGYVGQTGKATSPHVHYEVRINGKAVNPFNYVLEE